MMLKRSIVVIAFLLPFCHCSELLRDFTTILFSRDIVLVNNSSDSIQIQIHDTLLPEPPFNHQYDVGMAYLTPSFASIIPGGRESIALRIENTLEYDAETAIDSFAHLNSVYRQLALTISIGNASKLVFLPWNNERWTISELPSDSNSTAQKMKVECSDTFYVNDLIN